MKLSVEPLEPIYKSYVAYCESVRVAPLSYPNWLQMQADPKANAGHSVASQLSMKALSHGQCA